MSEPSLHPDEVLQALLNKGCRGDKQEKLRKLRDLCAGEYAKRPGLRDLSRANIARLAEASGLLKARTLYNRQSADYVALIDAWAVYGGPVVKVKTQASAHGKDKYAFLERIGDPAVRSRCQLALIERDRLKTQLDLLKGQANITINMRPLGAEISRDSPLAVIETAAQLTDSERNALKQALSSEFMKQRGWMVGNAGEIIDEKTKRFVFNPGFATAIQRILGLTETGASTQPWRLK